MACSVKANLQLDVAGQMKVVAGSDVEGIYYEHWSLRACSKWGSWSHIFLRGREPQRRLWANDGKRHNALRRPTQSSKVSSFFYAIEVAIAHLNSIRPYSTFCRLVCDISPSMPSSVGSSPNSFFPQTQRTQKLAWNAWYPTTPFHTLRFQACDMQENTPWPPRLYTSRTLRTYEITKPSVSGRTIASPHDAAYLVSQALTNLQKDNINPTLIHTILEIVISAPSKADSKSRQGEFTACGCRLPYHLQGQNRGMGLPQIIKDPHSFTHCPQPQLEFPENHKENIVEVGT